jgi:enoyl-CoA hydratase/carnithine racemase
MAAYANLEVEKSGHVAIATIANPPANTWTADGLAAMERLVADLEADRHVYALVVTGQGIKFFSAGADLKQFAAGDKAAAREAAMRFGRAFDALARFRGVSIAAINGYAMGGGLECALACDLRVAEAQTQLALPEAAVGLLPCGGGTQRLPWLVGEGWAKRMILCGERVDAQTAQRIGLVEEVVPAGGAKARALELAQLVEKQSPPSVAACKRLVQGARTGPPDSLLDAEREAFAQLFDTQDQKEGVIAFLEKRPPRWKNA